MNKTKNLIAITAASTAVLGLLAPGAAQAQTSPSQVVSPMKTNGRTQVSVDHSYTGLHVGTTNEQEARYSLSLTKLLIADYVFEHGSPQDKAKARQMIVRSDDRLAGELSRRYSRAISSKAAQYHMRSAVPAASWGNWRFSSADWSRYLSAKHREDPTATGPLLSAMRQSASHGADGYSQRYGVALLPGVQGWKSGWSDDRTTFHSSAGFGNGWAVAVQTNGRASDLNHDLFQALRSGSARNRPSAPGMTNYPARQAAQQGVEAIQSWITRTVGPIDKNAASAIIRDFDRGASQVTKTVQIGRAHV